jgi:hypothetical protein
MPEKFNPLDYKSLNEMPEDKKGEFAEVEGGFVTKSAKEYSDSFEKEAEMLNSERSFLKKIFNRDKVSFVDIAEEEAIKEDWARGNAGREKLVADLSKGLKRAPEDVEAFIDRCDEIMSGVPSAEEKEEDELTPLQRKISGRLKSCLWSYKKGDAVDAIMSLYSQSTWRDSQPDRLQSKLAKNAGEELMRKMQELRRNQPSRPTEEDSQYHSEEDLSEWEAKCSKYWDEEVVPVLIEVLKKSEKF